MKLHASQEHINVTYEVCGPTGSGRALGQRPRGQDIQSPASWHLHCFLVIIISLFLFSSPLDIPGGDALLESPVRQREML